MTKADVKELRAKILQGIDLSYARLLRSKQREDGELVISRRGEIIRVKARELKE
jgi:hypothetical protein